MLRIGIVVPHIFMHRDILPGVIFSPATLALDVTEGLIQLGEDVTLFSPGPISTPARNITADLSYFQQELDGRGDTYLNLLKKHPFTFVTLARQVQSELIAEAFAMANRDELDVVHIYTNEEDTALPFASLCKKPVIFTHHDPFNFLVKYKNVFPKYKHLNWISISDAQRAGMPPDTNWAGTVYHGIAKDSFNLDARPKGDYLAYLGRIIQPKGLHIAIAAVKKHNQTADKKLRLKIAGKHYAGHKKDTYWQEKIAPLIDGDEIEYIGFIGDTAGKQEFLGNAQALIVPSLFEEPFGMVMIEALACGTPIVGLDSGAIGEVIEADKTGVIVQKVMQGNGSLDEDATAAALCQAVPKALKLDRQACRAEFEARFTSDRMCRDYLEIYKRLAD